MVARVNYGGYQVTPSDAVALADDMSFRGMNFIKVKADGTAERVALENIYTGASLTESGAANGMASRDPAYAPTELRRGKPNPS